MKPPNRLNRNSIITRMQTIQFSKLVWVFYPTRSLSKWLIIVAIWAPNIEDIESLRNASILTDAWYDVFVPEYYWFCRSNGKFSPMNSILSLLDSYKIFANGYICHDIYTWSFFQKKYQNIIFLWLSYGGWLVLALPRFCKAIHTIWAFYPVVEYRWLWKCGTEESGPDFLLCLRRQFWHLYRLSKKSLWKDHFSHKNNLAPIESINMKHLKWLNIFLAHGKKDTSIKYVRTEKYSKKITWFHPKNHRCIIYPDTGHGYETLIPASYDFTQWLSTLSIAN